MSVRDTHDENRLEEKIERQGNPNEISLKELILLVGDYAKEVWRSWRTIALIVLPLIGFFLLRALMTTPMYSAKLTFMVNENGTKRQGLSGILGEFGLGMSAGTEYNLDKILDLSRSMLIVRKALFQKVEIEQDTDFLANHFIHILDLHQTWKRKSPELAGYLFTHDSLPVFNRKDRRVLKLLYSRLAGNPAQRVPGVIGSSYSSTSGIMTLTVNTPSETLSLKFIDALFENLSSYYIESAIEQQKETYEKLAEKVDSIGAVLNSKEYELANFEDSNRSLIAQKKMVKKEKLQREIGLLTVMHAEAVRNLEVTEFSLKNQTPFIKAIDEPFSPLSSSKPTWWKNAIIGGMIGFFLGCVFVVGRKIYREVMKGA
ncbi:MAG: hypothetical protein KDC43_08215 [Saprospiraceae bacterium]|nr:hypothetical protein [Saprospiraceae bacterium]MCB0681122.1 hypothetical protein [Saprospiraceae bacterium]